MRGFLKERTEELHAMHQLHVGGQVGRMQPQVTWVWGCMGDKENMPERFNLDFTEFPYNDNVICLLILVSCSQ